MDNTIVFGDINFHCVKNYCEAFVRTEALGGDLVSNIGDRFLDIETGRFNLGPKATCCFVFSVPYSLIYISIHTKSYKFQIFDMYGEEVSSFFMEEQQFHCEVGRACKFFQSYANKILFNT